MIKTPEQLRRAITLFSSTSPVANHFSTSWRKLAARGGVQRERKVVWYRTQHEHWLGWLRGYSGPGSYDRNNWHRSAEFVYNHIVNPQMLVYLAEAADIPKALLTKATKAALANRSTMTSMSSTIRYTIPWPLVEKALLAKTAIHPRRMTLQTPDMKKRPSILRLNLHREFSTDIAASTKKTEFRELKRYWRVKPLRVLIIPDKFKGTLAATAAAAAIAQGWHAARPGDRLTLLPMSDGGDGFGEAMSKLMGARAQRVRTIDAAHRPCVAPWWWEGKTRTAIIESARVIGLAMLPPKQFHPFALDTFGMGAVFRAVARNGAKCCLVGIGGSASNDGGFGLARAMGWEFRDRAGKMIEHWRDLQRLELIRRPATGCLAGISITVAVDVQNPLLGARGATRVYGPQKGLGSKDFELAEKCLARLARVWKRDFGKDLSRVPGAGAAGGLGFGLLAFLGARLAPGFDLFARQAGLEQRLRSTDLVITGEGSIDESTLMGKGVGQIAMRCRQRGIQCIGLGGVVARSGRIRRAFAQTQALTDVASVKEAKNDAAFWLERLAARLAESCGDAI